MLAAEALRASGPTLRFQRPTGIDLVSGVFSGPDQTRTARPGRGATGARPWTGRTPRSLICGDIDAGPLGGNPEPTYAGQAASGTDIDVQDRSSRRANSTSRSHSRPRCSLSPRATTSRTRPARLSAADTPSARPDALSSPVATATTVTMRSACRRRRLRRHTCRGHRANDHANPVLWGNWHRPLDPSSGPSRRPS